jgi:ABC-type branched-subunit amino acid transport system ATPase component
MVETIRAIRDTGTTIILVEHAMRLAMNVCDRITVISYGRKIAEGLPEEIRSNDEVVRAYLGKEEDDDTARDRGSHLRYGRAQAIEGISTKTFERGAVALLGAVGHRRAFLFPEKRNEEQTTDEATNSK